uniref:Uncharacterized protein n=1 Tax=Vitis vinifera TaxID=29760 RepID=F6H4E9_VITVI
MKIHVNPLLVDKLAFNVKDNLLFHLKGDGAENKLRSRLRSCFDGFEGN